MGWRDIQAGSDCPEPISPVEMSVPKEELLVEEEDPEREENPECTSTGLGFAMIISPQDLNEM